MEPAMMGACQAGGGRGQEVRRDGALAASDGRCARGTGTHGLRADDTHAAHQRGVGSIPDAVQQVAVSVKRRIAPSGAIASKRPPGRWRSRRRRAPLSHRIRTACGRPLRPGGDLCRSGRRTWPCSPGRRLASSREDAPWRPSRRTSRPASCRMALDNPQIEEREDDLVDPVVHPVVVHRGTVTRRRAVRR